MEIGNQLITENVYLLKKKRGSQNQIAFFFQLRAEFEPRWNFIVAFTLIIGVKLFYMSIIKDLHQKCSSSSQLRHEKSAHHFTAVRYRVFYIKSSIQSLEPQFWTMQLISRKFFQIAENFLNFHTVCLLYQINAHPAHQRQRVWRN